MAISVNYTPLYEEAEEGGDFNGIYAVVKYLVDWNDRFTFVNEMLGGSSMVGGVWQQTPPHAYGPSPNMFALGAIIQGDGDHCTQPDNHDIGAWTKAKVAIRYGTPQWNFSQAQDPFCLNTFAASPQECQALLWSSSEMDTTTETFSIPGTHARFESDGQRLASPIRLIVPIRTLTIMWHRYPAIPAHLDQTFDTMLNDQVFLGRAPGTVQYLGMSNRRQLSSDGTLAQQLAMTFRWRQYDWNMEPKMKVKNLGDPVIFSGWDYVLSGGERRYPYGNLFNLITFNPVP